MVDALEAEQLNRDLILPAVSSAATGPLSDAAPLSLAGVADRQPDRRPLYLFDRVTWSTRSTPRTSGVASCHGDPHDRGMAGLTTTRTG